MIDSSQVAHAHNAMAGEYDRIEDLWYSHLFSRVHDFIVRHLPSRTHGAALDVGCGTGFQSILLAHAGFSVRGFDLAESLVEVARQKAANLDCSGVRLVPLYESSLPGVRREHLKLLRDASRLRNGLLTRPDFVVADATSPESYEPGQFDVIVCCGSVLSFIDQYEEVLALMARSLRTGGVLFLEVEQRLNFDLLWPFADSLLRGALHFEQGFEQSTRNLLTKPGESTRIDFPFVLSSGQRVILPLWLFSVHILSQLFTKLGLIDVGHAGAHAVTNLIPSTVLHKQPPGRLLRAAFRPLAATEKQLSTKWPFWRLGCSVVYALKKRKKTRLSLKINLLPVPVRRIYGHDIKSYSTQRCGSLQGSHGAQLT